MGDIVPATSNAGALTVVGQQPEKSYEERLQEAQVHEEKLRRINEELPTRIYNVVGSCAGAGSGDFHYYRQIRRAEQDRVRRMEAEDKKQDEVAEFEAKQRQAQQELEQRTAKKRSKRQKKKEKKKQKKAQAAAGGGAAAGAGGEDGSSSEQESEGAPPPQADLD